MNDARRAARGRAMVGGAALGGAVTAAHAMVGGLRGTPSWRPGRDAAAERHPAAATGVVGSVSGSGESRSESSRSVDSGSAGSRPDGGHHHVLVVGGGIAGLSAAVGLAERGVRVTLVEAQPSLGGRVRSWPVEVPGDGPHDASAHDEPTTTMSRGFHAFFRQYYTLRALLRRVDPTLAGLRPVDDYPLRHADGTQDSFTKIATTPPWNFLSFVARSPSFGLTDLARVDADRALDLLDVVFPATYSRYDGVSAAQALDALRFPARMRALALEVFARSFFADPRDFSAGELIAMFHMYFLGSGEGLLFDVSRDDFDSMFWAPLGRYLTSLGADVVMGRRVASITRDADGFTARVGDDTVRADAVVLATSRDALQELVATNPSLGGAPEPDQTWREAVLAGRMAPRFIVQRLWFERRVTGAPFVGTAAFGHLDNVSLVHELEDGAAAWAARHGGSVVELHAYAVPETTSDAEVLTDLRAQLERLHPELTGCTPVHEEVLVEADCPLAGTDEWAARPGVVTPDPMLVLAGDGVRCELPVALMERAATTGFQAANALLASWNLPGHDLWSVPTRARFPRTLRAARAALRLRDAAPGRRAG